MFLSALIAHMLVTWQCDSDCPVWRTASTILYRLELQEYLSANAKEVAHYFPRKVQNRTGRENLTVLREGNTVCQ
jgi:hypothetical protein